MSTDVTRDLIYFEVALIINEDGNRSDNIYISDGTLMVHTQLSRVLVNHLQIFQDEINGDVLFRR